MMDLGTKVSYEVWSVNNHVDPVNYPDSRFCVTSDLDIARSCDVGEDFDRDIIMVTVRRQLMNVIRAREES